MREENYTSAHTFLFTSEERGHGTNGELIKKALFWNSAVSVSQPYIPASSALTKLAVTGGVHGLDGCGTCVTPANGPGNWCPWLRDHSVEVSTGEPFFCYSSYYSSFCGQNAWSQPNWQSPSGVSTELPLSIHHPPLVNQDRRGNDTCQRRPEREGPLGYA